MITQFKMFEFNISKPQIGDYVLCKETLESNLPERSIFIENNIGEIIRYNTKHPRESIYQYIVFYETAPPYLFSNSEREMSDEEILYWSKNKKDLEVILATKKYNL